MTDPKNASGQPIDHETLQAQPISVKSWAQKLLVALLCVASFYGGWKSYESYMTNECVASGGRVVEGDKTRLCDLS